MQCTHSHTMGLKGLYSPLRDGGDDLRGSRGANPQGRPRHQPSTGIMSGSPSVRMAGASSSGDHRNARLSFDALTHPSEEYAHAAQGRPCCLRQDARETLPRGSIAQSLVERDEAERRRIVFCGGECGGELYGIGGSQCMQP